MKQREQAELLTVQEFAEKAGVSVQAVYKRLNNSLNPYIQLVDGRKMLKSSALYEVYGVEIEQPIQPSIQLQLNGDTDMSEVHFLRRQVEQLQAELAQERRHSREMSEQLARLADQAQQLQLAQMQPAQLSEGTGAASTLKKHWLAKIFGR